MINKLIVDTLSPLAKTAYGQYIGTEKSYIVFQIYNNREGYFADNEAQTEIHYIQLTFYYNDPAEFSKIRQIKDAMKSAGFLYDYGKDLPQADGDNYWGRTMDFIYTEFL